MEEKFRISWRGTITSSLGYSVRGSTRVTVTYRDQNGRVTIPAELLDVAPYGFAVRVADIPEHEGVSQAEIVDRLRRAFRAHGALLEIEET